MPTYRKVNPSQAPIMVLSLTSDSSAPGQLYDLASTILSQNLSQVQGVGEVQIGGSSLPAVRVELEPQRAQPVRRGARRRAPQPSRNANVLPAQGLGGSQRPAVAGRRPATSCASARDYRAADHPLRRTARPVRLKDVAKVSDGVEDRYNSGFFNDDPAVLLMINRQAGANIIETVDAINAQLPALQALLPASVKLSRGDGPLAGDQRHAARSRA